MSHVPRQGSEVPPFSQSFANALQRYYALDMQSYFLVKFA